MDVRERVLLPLHAVNPNGGPDPNIDIPALFLHLLLFDTVILESARLTDIAALVRAIGAEETIELLDAGCIHIRSTPEAIGAMNHPRRIVELLNISVPDHAADLRAQMRDAFEPLGLKTPVLKSLKRAVRSRRLLDTSYPPPLGFTAIADAFREAVANSPVFDLALQYCARKYAQGVEIPAGSIRCEVVDPTKNVLGFDASGVKADPALITEAVRRACLAMAGLNAEFGKMQRDDAVTALDEDSASLMQGKLEFLWKANDPDRRIEAFSRTLSAIDLPDFEVAVQNRGIKIERFLAVRDTAECREFRSFLLQSEHLDEAQLRERTRSVRARIGEAAQTTLGKSIRFLATAAIGLATGDVTGLAAGGVDAFLVEKLFARSGIVTFVGKQYPSIFGK